MERKAGMQAENCGATEMPEDTWELVEKPWKLRGEVQSDLITHVQVQAVAGSLR